MKFSEVNLVEVIAEAAKSELGIIALIILCLSIVGVVLFRKSDDSYKLKIFYLLVVGLCIFVYSALQVAQPAAEPIKFVQQDCQQSDLTSQPVVVNITLPDNLYNTTEKTEEDKGSSIVETTEPEDSSVNSEPQADIALEPMASLDEGFIYLGTFRSGEWSDPRFKEASGALKTGDIITLATQRKMFECAPYRKSLFSMKYTYCNKVIGQSEAGEKLEVIRDPVLIGLSRAWVYVREMPSND